MFAVLGEIEFEVNGGMVGMDLRSPADWAEHALIQGKPLLEWMGEGLDEYSLSIRLHAALGDPEARLRALREAKSKHEPLAFVLGSGDYLGAFVITDISSTPQRSLADGRLLSGTVQVTLREFAGPFKRPIVRPGLVAADVAGSSLASAGSPAVVASVTPKLSMPQALLTHARSVGNMLGAAQQLHSAIKNGNPALLLSSVPQLLGATSGAIAPLTGLTRVAGLLSEGAELAQVGANVLGNVNKAVSSLTLIDMSSVGSALDSIASADLRGVSDAIAGLSAVDRTGLVSTLAGLGTSSMEVVTGALGSLKASGMGDVVQALGELPGDVAGAVTGALAAAKAVDLDNVVARVSASAAAVDQAMDVLDGASVQLAGLAAQVVTRRA